MRDPGNDVDQGQNYLQTRISISNGFPLGNSFFVGFSGTKTAVLRQPRGGIIGMYNRVMSELLN